jgi:hypothetical protein
MNKSLNVVTKWKLISTEILSEKDKIDIQERIISLISRLSPSSLFHYSFPIPFICSVSRSYKSKFHPVTVHEGPDGE